MKIDPVVAGQTDGHDEASSCFSQLCERNAPIKSILVACGLVSLNFVVHFEGCILCRYRLYCVSLVAVCNVYSPVLLPPVHLICSQSHGPVLSG
jgi:hypothetical protein